MRALDELAELRVGQDKEAIELDSDAKGLRQWSGCVPTWGRGVG